ncbi:MAG: riboflavin synthase [Bacteroidetes bacterium]|nr:MAG: riboflavin synthase [Bacteroidota bacterium]
MFTGIIETLAEVIDLNKENSNLHITFRSDITSELKIDQSIAHNGVCLTVVDLNKDTYTVTAIEETLNRSNLNALQIGDKANLERCMRANDRLDGHIVQGHIDQTAKCIEKTDENGSWYFTFKIDNSNNQLIIEKGSIAVNGVSLTISQVTNSSFSVAIIPYTYVHTNFNQINVGDLVNIEFDVVGKYIQRANQ